jgi:hypothetical protein
MSSLFLSFDTLLLRMFLAYKANSTDVPKAVFGNIYIFVIADSLRTDNNINNNNSIQFLY